jgi:hypothetical protein
LAMGKIQNIHQAENQREAQRDQGVLRAEI